MNAGWCSGTVADFPRRRMGVQIQSEAGSSGYQAVIRASKVTRVHSGLGLRPLCCSSIAAPKGPWPKRTRKGDRHLDH